MKALILGRDGYLARSFHARWPSASYSVLTDVTDIDAVRENIHWYGPDVVINCAGKTHSPQYATIDGCEQDKQAKADTYRVNVIGALRVRDACAITNTPLIHLGSGCIFDGFGEQPLTEDQEPNPVSYYGETKAQADRMVSRYDHALILRLRMPVSDDQHPRNLLVKLAKYDAVVDAPNSITDVRSLISAAWQLFTGGHRGIFNVVNPGAVSPYEIARMMGRTPIKLSPDGLNAMTVAGRSNCVLSTAKLEAAGIHLEDAQTVLTRHIAALSVAA